jgi:hypothetical protein
LQQLTRNVQRFGAYLQCRCMRRAASRACARPRVCGEVRSLLA